MKNRDKFDVRETGFAVMFNDYNGLDKYPKSIVKQVLAKVASENPDLDPRQFGVFMGKVVHYTGKKDPNSIVGRNKHIAETVTNLLPENVATKKSSDFADEKWVALDLTGTDCGKKYAGLIDLIKEHYTISDRGRVRYDGNDVNISMHNANGDVTTAQVHLGKYCCPTLKSCIVASFYNATGDQSYAENVYATALVNMAN